MTAITADLLARYDRPGPRYTSYPTAAEFHADVGAGAYAEHLARAATRVDEPLGLYVHLPFCQNRCHYCGCNVVITKQRGVARDYLTALQGEIRDVAARLGKRRTVRQMHWGGGTPTYLWPEQIRELGAFLHATFEFEPEAELAVEVDPRVTTARHLRALRDVGFNRISLGVQDFTPAVQVAIGRLQGYEETADLVAEARALGFGSINLDLIYGLPHQTAEAFAGTLEQTLVLRPDRVAVYGYAHMPWLKPHQRKIDDEALSDARERLELLAAAGRAFTGDGYVAIGMDHFALPEDELGRARNNGTLWRNFMGYTVRHAPDTVAFGMSAIGDVDGAYIQNEHKLNRYRDAVAAHRLPAARGFLLSADDRIRRHVITALMCNGRLDIPATEAELGIDFEAYFEDAREPLEALEKDGFLTRSADALAVTEFGAPFVRNVAMVFDAYLAKHETGEGQRFSRTV
ncbi:MAG: oxygen-independent coproporphyrinogen III oxidase [Planctomycetota bacterium]|nr:oxygen-independent coproporphyrinogen III oxidase [Planctomycetota bacterium]